MACKETLSFAALQRLRVRQRLDAEFPIGSPITIFGNFAKIRRAGVIVGHGRKHLKVLVWSRQLRTWSERIRTVKTARVKVAPAVRMQAFLDKVLA